MTPPDDNQQDSPALPEQAPVDPAMEERLSGAYRRILRITIVLSVVGSLAAVPLAGWRCGLGLAIGSLLAFVNFVWLHYGTERMVQRMLASGKKDPGKSPSRFRFALPFPLRYALMIAVAYVILKSYPGLLVGFLVGLILPIIASMGEGIYEALAISRIDQT